MAVIVADHGLNSQQVPAIFRDNIVRELAGGKIPEISRV
jgi:hypothetical protein